jgi:hypothetical protein
MLPKGLVRDEYRSGRLRGFAILAILVVEEKRRREGCTVVERVGKEAFSRRWLRVLVWIAKEVEGERAQFEEVRRDELEVALALGLRWSRCAGASAVGHTRIRAAPP